MLRSKEWSLLSEEERLILHEAILAAALDAIVTVDLDGKIIEWNHAAEEIFGYKKQEVVGEEMATLIIPPKLREAHLAGMKRFRENHTHTILNRRIELEAMNSSGKIFPIELSISPIEFKDQTFFTARIRNITDRKNHEQSQTELLHELNHRVKNLLAVVSTMVRNTTPTNLSEYVQTLEKRIRSLSEVHTQVARNNWGGVGIMEIVQNQLIPFPSSRIEVVGPEDIVLNPTASQAFGIVLHELLTNAAKHGSLSTNTGRILLCWEKSDDGICISWREMDGPLVTEPKALSYGMKMIQGYLFSVFRLKNFTEVKWKSSGLQIKFFIPRDMLL